FGMYSSIVSMTVSAKSSRRSGHVPFRNVYGAYWMKQDMMCFPGGARVGSKGDGTHMSMNGRWEKSPYFASSYAFSMSSTVGPIEMAPWSCGSSAGRAEKLGGWFKATFALPDDTLILMRSRPRPQSAQPSRR